LQLAYRALLVLTLACGFSDFAFGQAVPNDFDILRQEPVLPRDLGLGPTSTQPSAFSRISRVRLFSMPTAAPLSAVDVESDVDPFPAGAGCAPNSDAADEGRVQLAMVAQNPFFDFRRSGDPGGVGYYKLYSQWLLFDTPNTGVSLGLQAVTPAGLEANGLPDGPTYLSPHLAWFYEVAPGTALQGFVGKNVRAREGWSDAPIRGVRYGLALQSPFPGLASDSSSAVHVFLEALGRYRFEGDPSLRTGVNWQLIPGIHWRMAENWWLAGGMLMPLTIPRADSRLWQITCSWQF